MLTSFTRNYEDNSTEAGFQFTFYCDICNDGFKSSFIESETNKKNKTLKGIGEGVWAVTNMFSGALNNLGWAVDRGADVLSRSFDGMSAEWQKEHERAFELAQQEAQVHFHRCHGCHRWVCDDDYNVQEGLCVECAPKENIAVAKAKAVAMQRNLDDAANEQVIWSGKLESKTTVCPSCGQPAGSGKFCTNCGASLDFKVCPGCGHKNSGATKFCSECGTKLDS